MKKPGLLVSILGLMIVLLLGIGLGSRSAHSFTRKALGALNPAASASITAHADSNPDAAKPAVIRFVANPEPAPPLELHALDGQSISSASLTGKIVLLNFWATWCPPCRAEIPGLIELQSRYKDRLQVIGISMDDSPAADVKEFAANEHMNYPVVMWNDKIVQAYGDVPALPTTFVINQDGRVVQKHVGLVDKEQYDLEIRSLLKMPVQAKIETFTDVGQIFAKNAANATSLPGIDMNKLTPAQRKIALKRMNSEMCTCGCKFTIAQCRINDSDCPISKKLAQKIVDEVASGAPAPPAGANSAPDTDSKSVVN